jgi:DNA-binding NtrC family response regulator
VLPEDSRILVLDDEPAIVALVTATLEAAGAGEVHPAESLRAARKAWETAGGNIDLLLTDFSLPDGPATDLIRELLAQKPSLRILMMSGFSAEMLDLDPALSRHVKTIQKPFRPSELRELLSVQFGAAVAA